jgi:hypothetical protein
MTNSLKNRLCPNTQCSLYARKDEGNIVRHGFFKKKRGLQVTQYIVPRKTEPDDPQGMLISAPKDSVPFAANRATERPA